MEDLLKQILLQLNDIQSDVQIIKDEQQNMKNEQQGMKTVQHQLLIGQDEIKRNFEALQTNIIKHIGDYSENIIEYVDDKTEALNKRIYHIETNMQRLTRQ